VLGQQAQSDSFGGPVETSFAVLFLKNAALPAITGR
jgi:hypothetical protein